MSYNASPVFASVSLLTLLATSPAAPTSSGPPSATASGSSGPTVAAFPLTVEGALPPLWRDEADERLQLGLARGRASSPQSDAIVRLEWSACTTVPGEGHQAECASAEAHDAGADFAILSRLVVDSERRNYTLEIRILATQTGREVATLRGACDLCGFEDGVGMVEAKAAGLSALLERIGASNAIVAFMSTPPGVKLVVDGDPAGVTPLELPLAPGTHRIQGTKAGYLPQAFEIDAIEAVRKEFTFRLIEAPAPLPEPAAPPKPAAADHDAGATRRLITGGWVVTSSGLLATVAGATLLALNGRSYQQECEADVNDNCRLLYGTQTGGAISTALGSAIVGAGVVLLTMGLRRRGVRRAQATARVRPGVGTLGLRF